MFTTDVLVAGAGPAGLATAVTALRHGARVLVVERRAGTSTVPRATGVSIRTMELFRLWGVAEAVRAGSVDCDPTVAVTRTLAEEPQEIVPLAYPPLRDTLAASPALPALCPQDHIEPVLVAEVRRLGGVVRFGAALTGLRTTSDGVRAVLGQAGRVRARFVVGADGPRSTVRTTLGIGWEHLGKVGEFEQVLFLPDLAARLERRTNALVFVKHPDAEGVLLPNGGRPLGFHPRAPRGRRRLAAAALGRTAAHGHRVSRPAAGDPRRGALHHGRRRGQHIPRGAWLPGRRRRAPHDPVRGCRDEHRDPRRPRARLAAGLGGPRPGRGRAARQLRRRARTGGAGERRTEPARGARSSRRAAARSRGHLPVAGDRRRRRPGRSRPPPHRSARRARPPRVAAVAGSPGVDPRPVREPADRARRARR